MPLWQVANAGEELVETGRLLVPVAHENMKQRSRSLRNGRRHVNDARDGALLATTKAFDSKEGDRGRHERDEGLVEVFPEGLDGSAIPCVGDARVDAALASGAAGRRQASDEPRLRDGRIRDQRAGRAPHRGPDGIA